MAAIEKICELSGEHPGWKMYGYKRNHIQIMPKYRKKFRGVEATLHFFKSDLFLADRYGYQIYHPSVWMSRYEPLFTSEKELSDYLRVVEKQYVKQQYFYVLEVNDPALQGDVEGRYSNYTTQPNQVIRRMKRLTRDYNLKVIFHECTHRGKQMNIHNRKLLQLVYGLNYSQCNKVFSLMRKQGLSIDVAAKRIKEL